MLAGASRGFRCLLIWLNPFPLILNGGRSPPSPNKNSESAFIVRRFLSLPSRLRHLALAPALALAPSPAASLALAPALAFVLAIASAHPLAFALTPALAPALALALAPALAPDPLVQIRC